MNCMSKRGTEHFIQQLTNKNKKNFLGIEYNDWKIFNLLGRYNQLSMLHGIFFFNFVTQCALLCALMVALPTIMRFYLYCVRYKVRVWIIYTAGA